MKKIAFIGAGSYTFVRNLVRDILTFPAFSDCHIALMDINEERLSYAKTAVEKIVEQGGYPAEITATTDRVEALEGADGVISALAVVGVEHWKYDVLIPEKYGISYVIGDTRGPAGIFRGLRTIPVMLDICRDIEKYCPNAIFLNYTNPMSMLCRAMQGESRVALTGLCHSVQGTAEMLAKWIGASMDEITYLCAGINHQAFFIEYKWNGKDAYPLLRKAIQDPEIYNKEIVRNEMFKHLGYYVTESSGHNSEYNPWFRKRKDLIEKYCDPGTGWNPGKHHYAYLRDIERSKTWRQEFIEWSNSKIDLSRGNEYAAYIFNAIFGDGTMYKFNGNVRNFGIIDNLPYGCCVEVPVLASKKGLEPIRVGSLPTHLALMDSAAAYAEELAVEGGITGNPEKIYQACYFDPLTSAILSLEEIRNMVDEMFEANKSWLPQFKHLHR